MATGSPALPHFSAVIAAALERGAHVLTANARAARALSVSYAEDARAAGRLSWRAPAIQDWSSWQCEQYEQLAGRSAEPLPLLLSTLQEQLLWKRVQTQQALMVVSPDKLAALAQGAYALLGNYNAHASRRASWAAAHEDAEHFLRWADAFDEECEALAVLPPCALTATLVRHAARLHTAPELLLVGFDRFTPAQNALLDALEHTGVHVGTMPDGAEATDQRLVAAEDEQEELRACALWVRARLEHDPGQRLAVLVPELSGTRAEIDRAFRRVLLPRSAQSPPGATRLPYEFSLGSPLGEVPVIQAALTLLRWLAGPVPGSEVTWLLVSGFAAIGAAESRRLAEADVVLRRKGILATGLGIGTLLRRGDALLPATFVQRFHKVESWARREAGRQRTYAEWVEAVDTQLKDMGWPGHAEHGSRAFQARKRFDSLLAQLGTLGFAGDTVSWADFVREVQVAAHGTLFAAESLHAPVQILGAAEASGQQFDAVWFLQVTDGRWPLGGRVHPLLAPALQRDAGMPHSSPDADYELAREQMRRILHSAPTVVCSYSKLLNGSPARPSPLLGSFAGGIAVPASAPAPQWPDMESAFATEPVAVAPWLAERAAGGSEVLKRQSACGFQSFAHRLGANALEEEAWGLDAADRATLLHAALQELWTVDPAETATGKLHTRDDLRRAIGDGSIDDKVASAVERSFRSTVLAAGNDPWQFRYLTLEQERLCTRIHAWLEVEQGRAEFSVFALEDELDSSIQGQLGALKLRLRTDRLDRLADGSRLVLDYKTADKVTTRLWEGARPDEPQLLIYALFGGIDNVQALAFAQIRAAKTGLIGLARDPATQLMPRNSRASKEGKAAPPDPRTLDDAMMHGWDQALRALADAYLRGDAPVNPKHGDDTCKQCGLYGICRVRSLKAAPASNGDHNG
ncbi:PD-(D/E)XK nuclease family protein [Acidipila sp. EB88]|uniref:PD-(D/E)XK nuclease family protein n=1 Tax=Acidipila sp. EB88 TaxID=2305226 RepID=UPI000F5F836F|nr:PD-(D/E)XK nuclease family protein [Acidipila sp. EB88]RRA47237.1 hypothetical protein D1Y84_01965 [Acidipila sp. EB88]